MRCEGSVVTKRAKLEHLRGLESHLRARIRGQDHLLPRLAALFCRAALALGSTPQPRASLLLVGPTGTGKSESFTCACEYVFGPERLVTIDLSEYQDLSAVNKLLGENRQDPGLLGRVLANASGGGLLFDEIEKAHSRVLDLFLQMLWRGCITDATGKTHQLANYVIGFTSNIGSAEAMRMEHASLVSVTQAILRRVGEDLRPELVGRIDETLVFASLGPEVQREICALEVTREIERLRGLGYDLEVSAEAMEFLIKVGFHRQLGARPLRKAVERHIQDAVVRKLLGAGHAEGRICPLQQRDQLVVEGV